MSRRVSLPGASELFRRTHQAAVADDAVRAGSGRVRHEEKITVYVSADELLALEQARLTLRARARHWRSTAAGSSARRSPPPWPT